MRDLIQILTVLAIALGAGLYAFGNHLDPTPSAANPTAGMHFNEGRHNAAAFASGWGVGFITLGVLSLVVPWGNVVVKKYHERPATGPT